MSTLPVERSIWIGNNIATIAYGFDIYMVIHSTYLLKNQNTLSPRKRVMYIGWGVIQLLIFTYGVATQAITEQFMWIDHRNFPGGPMAFFAAASSSWYQVSNVAACGVISIAMSDALLLYRCYIVWNASWRTMCLPVLIFMAEIVMGIFFIVQSALPNAMFFLERTTPFAIPWISLVAGLNIILTGLLVGKIFYVSRRVGYSSDYTGIMAMLVESAIPLTFGGLAFVIATARGSTVLANPLTSIVGALNVLCPQAIILRVAMGRAWTERTMTDITTRIEFSEPKSGYVDQFTDGEVSETTSTQV